MEADRLERAGYSGKVPLAPGAWQVAFFYNGTAYEALHAEAPEELRILIESLIGLSPIPIVMQGFS